jgi:serine/threonine protein kinase
MPPSPSAPPPSIASDEVLAELRHLDLFRSRPDISLTALAGNPRRRDHLTRRTFTVSHGGKVICHLTAGANLETLWKRTEAFHRASPAISGKPLFYEKSRHRDYLAREFIDGTTLEHLVNASCLNAGQARQHAAKIQRALETTTEPSNVAAAKAEARQVFEKLYALPYLSALDHAVFRDVLAPLVDRGIESTQPRTRWTNGDFTPHNLLLDANGNPRLIDYEFAARTHFFAEDAWRWQTFSSLPLPTRLEMSTEDPASDSTPANPIPPWMEIFFWAKQLVLSHETIVPEIASTDSRHAISQIVELTGIAGAPLASSLFIQTLKPDSELRTEVERLKIERYELSDKIARMHASRSWRYTAWCRAIRRWLAR